MLQYALSTCISVYHDLDHQCLGISKLDHHGLWFGKNSTQDHIPLLYCFPRSCIHRHKGWYHVYGCNPLPQRNHPPTEWAAGCPWGVCVGGLGNSSRSHYTWTLATSSACTAGSLLSVGSNKGQGLECWSSTSYSRWESIAHYVLLSRSILLYACLPLCVCMCVRV